MTPDQIDSLIHTAVFGATPEQKGEARYELLQAGAAVGIRFASIHDLYMAMGRGEVSGFTVPAINVRAMAYDTARAIMRAAKRLNAGAFIIEIARSEIGYTEQRPSEYAAVMVAAALREGFHAPLFLQGDHVQTNAKKYNSPDRDKEVETLKTLIREEMAAGFYNIDIDTSTLVDLDKATLDEQQAVNCELAADFTAFIRQHEPKGVTVSVGGEIGEVGGKNSDVHELHAFMRGYQAALAPARQGCDRHQQDQRADRHGARRLRRARRQGPHGREDRSGGARGAVARGARELRPGRRGAARRLDAAGRGVRCLPEGRRLRDPPRHQLPEHGLRPPAFPAELKAEMYAWVRENAPGRAEGEATPKSSSSTRRARRRSARSRSSSGRCRPRPAPPSARRSKISSCS